MKRQILDHYLPGLIDITSYVGIFTIEILSSQTNQTPRRNQTDDIDQDFSKKSTELILQNLTPKFTKGKLNFDKRFFLQHL